jgi:large subunit ribosomal protein L9
VAEQLTGKRYTFAAKASETRRLYGSINTQMIAEAVSEDIGVTIQPKQIESQPLRMIGKHTVAIRLTVDLIPEIEVIVHREGETPESALAEEEKAAVAAEEEQELDEGDLSPQAEAYIAEEEAEQAEESELPVDEVEADAEEED